MDSTLLKNCQDLIFGVDELYKEMSETEKDQNEDLFLDKERLGDHIKALRCFYDFMHSEAHAFNEDEYKTIEATKVIMESFVRLTYDLVKKNYEATVTHPYQVFFYNQGQPVVVLNVKARSKAGAIEGVLGTLKDDNFDTIEVQKG